MTAMTAAPTAKTVATIVAMPVRNARTPALRIGKASKVSRCNGAAIIGTTGTAPIPAMATVMTPRAIIATIAAMASAA